MGGDAFWLVCHYSGPLSQTLVHFTQTLVVLHLWAQCLGYGDEHLPDALLMESGEIYLTLPSSLMCSALLYCNIVFASIFSSELQVHCSPFT